MKILADLEILRNLKIINKKYVSNQNIKKVDDSILIKQFKNNIAVPAWIINKNNNDFLNNIVILLAKITKKLIN